MPFGHALRGISSWHDQVHISPPMRPPFVRTQPSYRVLVAGVDRCLARGEQLSKGRCDAGAQYAAKLLMEMQDTQPKPAIEIRDGVLHVAHNNTRQCLATPATHYGAGQRVARRA